MWGLVALVFVIWGIVFGVVGLTYVPQFIDGFFWDFLLRVGYVLAIMAIAGAISIGIALLEVRDSPPKQGDWTNPMAN